MTDRKRTLFRKETGAILIAVLAQTLSGPVAEAHRAYSSYGDIDETVINKMLTGKKQKTAKSARARAKKPVKTATPKTENSLSDTQTEPTSAVTSPTIPNKTATKESATSPAHSSPANSGSAAPNNAGSDTTGNTSVSRLMMGSESNTNSSQSSSKPSKKSKTAPTISAQEKMLSTRPSINPPTSLNLESNRQHQ